jgi:hypothetical protein
MSDFNIKISELNAVSPNPPYTEDFFPLVHSASMTTYRATLKDIGSLMTHSIFADTASYTPNALSASHANYADSASYARTSSYAISASHARLADSASYYPPQQFQQSASWASRSLQAYYATRSLDVDTHGTKFFYPWWNTADVPGTNGALETKSTLFYSKSFGSDDYGPIVIDPATTFANVPYITRSNAYPWYSSSGWWNPSNMTFPNDTGWQGDGGYIGGLFSPWPIVSSTFIGTDKKGWAFGTGSQGVLKSIWTGSHFSGSWMPLCSSFDQTFNGKWLRIAVTNTDPEWPNTPYLPNNVAPFESYGSWYHTGMFGRIRIVVTSTVLFGGSNQYQSIDLSIQNFYWSGEMTAVVNHAEGVGIVKAIRMSRTQNYAWPNGDPFQTLDILLDTFSSSDHSAWIMVESWGGIRFLNYPSLDPPPFTGSTTLQFPPRPGYYGRPLLLTDDRTYNISGRRVIIDPSATEITGTGMATSYTHSLNVSGGINTNTRYFCDGHPGLFTKVTYGTNNLYFSGGILVDKYPPDGPAPAGTPCGGVSTYLGGNAMPSEQTIVLGDSLGVVTVHFFTYNVPDRLQVIFDSNVVLNSGYRGDSAYQSNLNTALASYGSASEYITGGPQYTASFYKNSSTPTAKIQTFGPIGSTAWNYWISCPGQPIT